MRATGMMALASRIVLCVAIPLGSCSTIETTILDKPPDGAFSTKPLNRMYAGTVGNIRYLNGTYGADPFPVIQVILWLDTPFCFVLDTILLPHTICMQALYGPHGCERNDDE